MDAAEALFMEGGYAAIKLRHIANRLRIKEASLYYHFPKGKEELYIQVMRRSLERHRQGIEAVLRDADDDWVAQLRAIAYWLLSQQALDVMRMTNADFPAIDPAAALELEDAAYHALNLPLRQVLERAVDQQQAEIADTDLIAGILISAISSIHVIKHEWNTRTRQEMADILIQSWVNGLTKR